MKIAIVNDDPITLELLNISVLSTPEHQVIWLAESGEQAANFAQTERPDLILMDINMPNMNGVQATRLIMQQSPCAILIVTSSIEDHSDLVFDALGAGAVDAVNTPVLLGNTDANGVDSLLHKIAAINLLIDSSIKHRIKTKKEILLIGASTGGPSALATILAALPIDFPIPIVIVQHVDVQFVSGLCDWLNKQTQLTVKLAEQGSHLFSGNVYMANSDKHLTINKFDVVQYQIEPLDSIHRPSINVLFDSIAHNWSGEALGVLLTGMGKDGAAGLLAMHKQDFCTFAQDEQSCAVYGMPKAAINLNAVDTVLPLDEIAKAICRHFNVDIKSQVMVHE
ncbi:Chemotaxis response regulator protein-glutamate methylesterase CheB [hydrothermal vent metagenome]|uniref:protein-glutamate methylesterase n=1 Tax=hydrothermal vent metagenome TaxID=652676 RepID=A0A3B1A307_9ZZZZ